jgi:hypothetical protein
VASPRTAFYVRDVVRAGIVAAEEVKIKELSKRQNLPTLASFEGTADPLIRLDVGCSADLVKAFGRSGHRDTTGISGVCNGEGARTLRLRDGG